MKKILIIIISLLSINYHSQDIRGWNKPTSPEAAMIKKVGDIPVGLYTGTMNVPVELYTIKEGSFSLPITLQYNASGIKVDEQATWVGLGWNLAPEGTITQEVRGIRDEYDDVYKTAVPPAGYDAFLQRINTTGPTSTYKVVPQLGTAGWIHCGYSTSCGPWSQTNEDTSFVVQSLINGSGQPDIYNFNFAGYSGSFFLHPTTKQPVLLNKKDDIKFVVQNASITAIVSDGTKFIFSDLEVIDYMGSGGYSTKNGQNFKLTQIQFTNQKTINFEYQNARFQNIYFSQNRNVQVSVETGGGNSTCSNKLNYFYQPPVQNNYSGSVKILKSIKTAELTINFNLEDREDINFDYQYAGSDGTLKKLASVDFINTLNNKKIKSYKFDYSYFPYTSSFPSVGNTAFIDANKAVLGKRLKLNSVEAVTYDANGTEVHTNDIHSFEYNMQNTLPLKISFAKDFWGYYNGKEGNGTLMPDFTYFPYPLTVPSDYQGVNRHADKNYADAYILKKITYPTKGYSEFEYQPNTFANQYIPSEQNKINFYTNYNLANRGTGGPYPPFSPLEFDVPAGGTNVKFYVAFSPGFDGSVFGMGARKYSFSQMAQAQPSAKIYSITYNNGSPTYTLIKSWEFGMCNSVTFNAGSTCDKEEFVQLPAGKIKVVLSIDNSMYLPDDTYHLAGVDLRFTIANYALTNGVTSEGHGLRIKSIKNYSDQGVLGEWKEYEYQGGILHNRYDPFKRKTYYCYDCSSLTSCADGTQMSSMDVYELSDDMADRNFDAVGYDVVTEKNIDVNNGTTAVSKKTVHNYNNLQNTTANYFPVRKEEKNGLPMSEKVYNSSNNVILSKSYYYKNIIPENNFPNIDIQNTFLTNGADPLSPALGRTKYVYNVTPFISSSYKLDSLITKESFGNTIVKTKKLYNYNSRGFVNQEDTYYENNHKVITSITNYAEDVGNQLLINKNMVGIPLERMKTLTTGAITKTISNLVTVYPMTTPNAETGNLVLPLTELSYDLQDNQSIDITYNKYDIKGNLQQYTTKNNVPVSIIWGYNNTLPIAKVEGASYSQIESFVNDIVNASNIDALADSNNDESTFLNVLNAFRNNSALSSYQITTYTYDPLIGVRSITPPTGIKNVYIYDSSNKLKEVREQGQTGKLLKEYRYNYKH